MGSFIEINDTLQLTSDQGFPSVLDLEKHLEKPFSAKEFEDKIFEFKDKPSIRLYHSPPVRVFFVENKEGRWIYWGLVHIVEIKHDYINKTTSGKFKIIYINTPDEMKKAFDLTDRRKDINYFK